MTTAAAVRERPILFSGEMVRAILDGRKTQTRRVVLPQPQWTDEVKHTLTNNGPFAWPIGGLGQQCGFPLSLRYQVGDRLWVRETWTADFGQSFSEHPGAWWHEMPLSLRTRKAVAYLYYAADESVYHGFQLAESETLNEGDLDPEFRRSTWEPSEQDLVGRRWVPSIHMPRWASRLTLEITGIRVERLQAISGADARAEGIEPYPRVGAVLVQYRQLWDDLNEKRGYGWDVNPWVWVVEFRKVAP